MLKLKKTLMAVLVAMLIPVTAVYGQSPSVNIKKNQLNSGILSIDYKASQDIKTKVMIKKENKQYVYDLNVSGQYPLQLGDGKYQVLVLSNVAGNQYKVVKSEYLKVEKDNENVVYLQSIDMINWNEEMQAIKIAKEITKDAKTDKEKMTIVHNYITNKIKYDNKKGVTVELGYVPNIDETLNTSLGICYDYSVLYAAMMRSLDVPTKLVMGRNKDIEEYHAWNEVYLADSDQWLIIDTTYDAPAVQKGINNDIIKNPSDYTMEKQY